MRQCHRFVCCGLAVLLAIGPVVAPLGGAVPRFGVDQQNSRMIIDSLEDTGYPFQKLWQTDLGGKVESQPIVSNGRIYAQAGNKLVMTDMEGVIKVVSPVLSDSPMPSGSSPTLASTVHGDRIYQATRDHRLWALDPDTLQPLWDEGYITLSAGGRPNLHYRIVASPLSAIVGDKSYIAIGTGYGDHTGRAGQYADNGFFILEDTGSACQVTYCRQTAGEVTGSPLLDGEMVIATQNILVGGVEENLLICYDLRSQRELDHTPRTLQGIPGSPAAEEGRLYIADKQGRLYCYGRTGTDGYTLLWDTAPDSLSGTANLNSPTVGRKYVYLPIQQYRGSGGLLAVYDKVSGVIVNSLTFSSPLYTNVIYWQPQGSDKEFLLVYESSGRTQLLDAMTLEPVSGYMDEDGKIVKELMLPHAPTGAYSPTPIIGENHMLLVDGAGVLYAYQGRGQELELTTDLAVLEFVVPDSVRQGEKTEWIATVANLTNEALEQATVEWVENGRAVHREKLDFNGQESRVLSYGWQGGIEPGMIRAEVHIVAPDKVIDTDESNNSQWKYIYIPVVPSKANCAEIKERGDWSVTYAVLVGYAIRHRQSCNMNAGVRNCSTVSYTDYSSPVYSYVDVGYGESLSASVAVRTGQGRLPNPAQPTTEDQEGRGAWAIIPYSRSKGWNPDQVTRAGSGFTIQVETNYATDWEMKVPERASAIGGVFMGPGKVTAEFYDTRGKLVKAVALERTEGTNGVGKAVWQLPESKHTYLDGSTVSKRWFYTEPDIPDGEYQVLVRVEGAGLNSLHTCKIATVRIYGSVYDDLYERIIR